MNLPDFSITTPPPSQPLLNHHCLFSNTFLLYDIENNRFLLSTGVTDLNQLDCTHRVGDPVLPVCPAEHSQSALNWFHVYEDSCYLI